MFGRHSGGDLRNSFIVENLEGELFVEYHKVLGVVCGGLLETSGTGNNPLLHFKRRRRASTVTLLFCLAARPLKIALNAIFTRGSVIRGYGW